MSEPSRHHGFTLVEILIVMSLLSLIMVALGSAMHTMARTQERLDARMTASDEVRIATSFIRTTAERVSARENTALQRQGDSRYLFEASPQAMAWVGVMPARYGAGGRHFFRLAMEAEGRSSALVLRFQPWTDSDVFPDWQQAESRILIHNVTAFSVEFEDDLAPEPAWMQQWPIPERLPARVRFFVQTTEKEWPALIVGLRPMKRAGSNNLVTIGGVE